MQAIIYKDLQSHYVLQTAYNLSFSHTNSHQVKVTFFKAMRPALEICNLFKSHKLSLSHASFYKVTQCLLKSLLLESHNLLRKCAIAQRYDINTTTNSNININSIRTCSICTFISKSHVSHVSIKLWLSQLSLTRVDYDRTLVRLSTIEVEMIQRWSAPPPPWLLILETPWLSPGGAYQMAACPFVVLPRLWLGSLPPIPPALPPPHCK